MATATGAFAECKAPYDLNRAALMGCRCEGHVALWRGAKCECCERVVGGEALIGALCGECYPLCGTRGCKVVDGE